ncbi:MAG: hypothetical protein KJ718_01710 [Nanoarchaeota archaeon]|nr:hypothetical protein [Nanoarchaeota archaeon]
MKLKVTKLKMQRRFITLLNLDQLKTSIRRIIINKTKFPIANIPNTPRKESPIKFSDFVSDKSGICKPPL